MQIYMFFLSVLSCIVSAKGEVYKKNIGDSVSLPCNYTGSKSGVVWRISTANGQEYVLVVHQFGNNNPVTGENYTGRVSIDYLNGELVIHNLTCWDEHEEYTCQVFQGGLQPPY